MAKEADIDLGEELDQESYKKRKKSKKEVLAPVDVFDSDRERLHRKLEDEGGARHK